MMKRPRIKSPCNADDYVSGCERIAEFSTPNGKGGLISVRQHEDNRVTVDVYRIDAGVEVRTPQTEAARAMLATLIRVLPALEAVRRQDLENDLEDEGDVAAAEAAIAAAEAAGITLPEGRTNGR